MMFSSDIVPYLLAVGMATSKMDASTNCLGGPAFGLEAACDFNNFNGQLGGHPASEVLYQIIMQSPLDNSTFFRNDNHVTCLFKNSSFVLNGFGAGVGPVNIQLGGVAGSGSEYSRPMFAVIP